MLIFLAIVAIALAAVAGYIVGSRSSVRQKAAAPPPVTSPVTSVAATPPVAAPTAATGSDFGGEKARIIRSAEIEMTALRQTIADRDAALAQLGELAGERERLWRELAAVSAETARYRQLVIDIENNAPPPILSGATGPDDLKLIVGVGPVLERMLHNLGVTTFRQIARWSERDIAEFDARLPEFPGRIQRDQWVTQARALHLAKYGEAPDAERSRG